MTDAFKEVFVKVKAEYTKSQTMKTKMIDAFLVYCLATCGVQIFVRICRRELSVQLFSFWAALSRLHVCLRGIAALSVD